MAWAPPVPVRKHGAVSYAAPAPYAPPTPVYAAPPPVPARPSPPPVPDDGLIRVRALFDFPGTADGDLVFKRGDIIIVTQKLAPGWWEGTARSLK